MPSKSHCNAKVYAEMRFLVPRQHPTKPAPAVGVFLSAASASISDSFNSDISSMIGIQGTAYRCTITKRLQQTLRDRAEVWASLDEIEFHVPGGLGCEMQEGRHQGARAPGHSLRVGSCEFCPESAYRVGSCDKKTHKTQHLSTYRLGPDW